MTEICLLSEKELLDINAGDAKEVVTTAVGVCGGIVGAAGGFLMGYAVTGAVFTGAISVAGGVVGAIPCAVGGYVEAKESAEVAWDTVSSWF